MPTPAPVVTPDPFIDQLKKTLVEQSGMISSSDTQIESAITGAIEGVKKSNEASKQVIESKAGREISFAVEGNRAQETSFLESTRGFATNNAAYKSMVETNEKEIKDLAQRRDELILQGDAAAAATVSELMLKGLEFRQNAQQRYFSNLLATGNFALGAKEGERAERSQNFAERSAINNVALQYGLEVKPGDTIDTITSRAAPFASEEQRLRLTELRARITNLNAETARAMKEGDTMDPEVIEILARAASKGETGWLANVKDNSTAAAIFKEMERLNKPREWGDDELKSEAVETRATGISYNEARAAIASDARIINKDAAYGALKDVYGLNKKVEPYKLNFGNSLLDSGILGNSLLK